MISFREIYMTISAKILRRIAGIVCLLAAVFPWVIVPFARNFPLVLEPQPVQEVYSHGLESVVHAVLVGFIVAIGQGLMDGFLMMELMFYYGCMTVLIGLVRCSYFSRDLDGLVFRRLS